MVRSSLPVWGSSLLDVASPTRHRAVVPRMAESQETAVGSWVGFVPILFAKCRDHDRVVVTSNAYPSPCLGLALDRVLVLGRHQGSVMAARARRLLPLLNRLFAGRMNLVVSSTEELRSFPKGSVNRA